MQAVMKQSTKLRRRVSFRNFTETFAAVFVSGVFANAGYHATREGAYLVGVASVVLIAGACVVIWQLFARGKNRPLPADDASTSTRVRFHRDELLRQARALRSVPRWYVAPFVPGVMLFLLGIVVHAPVSPDRPDVRWWLAAIVALAGVCSAAFSWFIVRINRRAAAQLEAEAAAIEIENTTA